MAYGNNENVGWDAKPEAGTRKVLTAEGVDFAFRYCPSGTKGVWLLETPVTQGMYSAITGSNWSYFKSGDNYPVENVSWNDCQSFCQELNARNVAPAGFEFRLPTEAEWEYACRAGTTGRYNVDGVSLDELGWYGGNSGEKTHAVGGKRANAWGLYDMHGNVWEWCADGYDVYDSTWLRDPRRPWPGPDRGLRGGSWKSDAEYCRSTHRSHDDPTLRYNSCGFRLALGRKL